MTVQEIVSQTTRRLGSKEGWSDVQFLARQVCLLQNDLNNLASLVRDNSEVEGKTDVEWAIDRAAHTAKMFYDGNCFWYAALVSDTEQTYEALKSAVVDLQITLLAAANAISEITYSNFDVIEAAKEKAKKMGKRGDK